MSTSFSISKSGETPPGQQKEYQVKTYGKEVSNEGWFVPYNERYEADQVPSTISGWSNFSVPQANGTTTIKFLASFDIAVHNDVRAHATTGQTKAQAGSTTFTTASINTP